MIAELMAKIGVDISGLKNAEVAMKQFEGAVKGAFKRTAGEARPIAALEGALVNLGSGNVLGAISSVTSRLSVIGVVGGVAIGAIVTGLQALHDNAKRVDAAFKQLGDTVKIGPQAGAGAGQAKAHVDAVLTSLQGTSQTKMQRFWDGMWANLKAPPISPSGGLFSGGIFAGTSAADERRKALLEKQKAGVDSLIGSLQKQVEAESASAQATRISARESEALGTQLQIEAKTAAEVAKITYDAQVQKQKIKAVKGADPEEQKRALEGVRTAAAGLRQAARSEGETAKETANIAVQMKEIELEKEWGIFAAKQAQLAPEMEARAMAAANIASLIDQYSVEGGITEEKRAQLDLDVSIAKQTEEQRRKAAQLKAVDPLMERAKFGLEELAGKQFPGRVDTGSRFHQSVAAAQEAVRQQKLGEAAKARGHMEEAAQRFGAAEAIKGGIPLLKGSEKMPEFSFKSALESATTLVQMSAYLATIAEATKGGNAFLNK